jgi:hypothetical protein
MAKVFCVSYDLKDPPGNYSGLYKVLTNCTNWWHYLESTWLVVDESYDILWKKLQPQLGPKDGLLVIGVTDESAGWLPKDAWDWIRQNVDSTPPQPKAQLTAV